VRVKSLTDLITEDVFLNKGDWNPSAFDTFEDVKKRNPYVVSLYKEEPPAPAPEPEKSWF